MERVQQMDARLTQRGEKGRKHWTREDQQVGQESERVLFGEHEKDPPWETQNAEETPSQQTSSSAETVPRLDEEETASQQTSSSAEC